MSDTTNLNDLPTDPVASGGSGSGTSAKYSSSND